MYSFTDKCYIKIKLTGTASSLGKNVTKYRFSTTLDLRFLSHMKPISLKATVLNSGGTIKFPGK